MSREETPEEFAARMDAIRLQVARGAGIPSVVVDAEKAFGTGDVIPISEEAQKEHAKPGKRLIFHNTVVTNLATGKELSNIKEGKKPFTFHKPAHDKRYETIIKKKTSTDPRSRAKIQTVITLTYEKDGATANPTGFSPKQVPPTTTQHPARKTNEWSKPVWAKEGGILPAESTSAQAMRSGKNLEKPIQKPKGQLAFTIDRG